MPSGCNVCNSRIQKLSLFCLWFSFQLGLWSILDLPKSSNECPGNTKRWTCPWVNTLCRRGTHWMTLADPKFISLTTIQVGKKICLYLKYYYFYSSLCTHFIQRFTDILLYHIHTCYVVCLSLSKWKMNDAMKYNDAPGRLYPSVAVSRRWYFNLPWLGLSIFASKLIKEANIRL